MPFILFILFFIFSIPGSAFAIDANADDNDALYNSLEKTEIDPSSSDPWEGFNRPSFAFNRTLDKYVLKPVSSGYHWLLPEMVRNSIGNFFDNLGEPVNCANGLLQLNPDKTFTAFWRFTLNSTFGFAGLRDFAGEQGLHYHHNTFGETLETYGMSSGPYLVVPLLGPSNPRDTAGDVVDIFIDPFYYLIPTKTDIALTAGDVVDTRDQNAVFVDELFYNSIEPYSAMRSAYLQHKTFETRGGKTKQLD